MGVSAMRNAEQKLEISGAALRTHIPLHTMDQKRCFWIPEMGVFAMGNAKN